MINLKQNQANNVVLNLTANSDLFIFSGISPYFLFEFTSEATAQKLYFVTDNIADLSARTRYDQFTVIESGSTYTNLTGGTVHLTPGFFWLYNIYEQTTRNNLNPALTNGIVNTGRVYFEPNITNGFISYTGSSANNVFYTKY